MNKRTRCLLASLLGVFLFTACPPNDRPTDGVTFKNQGNTVFARLPSEPDRLNPLLTTSSASRAIWELVFYPLINIDPETQELEPVLALSRPRIEELGPDHPFAGGLSYTFQINPQARWDDGSPVTGHDVVFTFKALMNPNVPADAARANYESVRDIVVAEDDPLQLTFFTDETYLLGEAAVGTMNIFPAAVFDPEGLMSAISLRAIIDGTVSEEEQQQLQQFGEQFQAPSFSRDADKITGAGPYQLEQWEAGQYISMSRKQDWWGDDQVDDFPMLTALPDSLVFRIVTDQATVPTALKDELLDVANQIDARTFRELESNEFMQEHFALHAPDAVIWYYLALNTKDPRLEDRRVRRALAHSLDVDVIIEKLFSGLATRQITSVLPSKPYYDKTLTPIGFDVDQAIRLLQEAGWADTNNNGIVDKEINGETVELELDFVATPGATLSINIGELLKAGAAQAGMKINVLTVEGKTLMSEYIRPRNFQIWPAGAAGDPLPDDFTQLWHTKSNTFAGGNRTQFGNADTDALIDRIKVTLDDAERNELYRQFQQILYDEQPMIFLFAPKARIAISKRFAAEPNVVRAGYNLRTFDYIME